MTLRITLRRGERTVSRRPGRGLWFRRGSTPIRRMRHRFSLRPPSPVVDVGKLREDLAVLPNGWCANHCHGVSKLVGSCTELIVNAPVECSCVMRAEPVVPDFSGPCTAAPNNLRQERFLWVRWRGRCRIRRGVECGRRRVRTWIPPTRTVSAITTWTVIRIRRFCFPTWTRRPSGRRRGGCERGSDGISDSLKVNGFSTSAVGSAML